MILYHSLLQVLYFPEEFSARKFFHFFAWRRQTGGCFSGRHAETCRCCGKRKQAVRDSSGV
ncbi:hypothetical protein CSB45_02140 [candidate division KSB3 bacterium]|uniref:Uncharacterized protein n=1 Tax=candidate division KSB3 bacterium TaxID=2044937 RepID=A0A2G6EAM8_9BACT|nr:MAG: hypothetical protein CSB45_02140 [candidate division KSB3 bacterium]PIE30882.1 MAG: hypothetical protein CSA57_00750 [candidate division KSB3 bacterium]